MRDDRVYLRHVLDAIGRVEEYVTAGREAFLASQLYQDAVIRQLTVIGEAANKTSDELQQHHPDVHWPRIISLRNSLIHEYWGVNLSTLWDIIQNDLPTLKQRTKQILEELDRAG